MSPAGGAFLFALIVVVWALGRAAWGLLRATATTGLEAVFLQVGFGIAALTWWGVILAEVGHFAPTALLGTGAILAVAARAAHGWRGSRGAAASAASGGRSDRLRLGAAQLAAVIAVLIVAWWQAGPMFDVRVEARDPGVYANAGLHLARSGAISWFDETVLSLSPEARRYFFPPPGYLAAQESWRYLGFFLESYETGRVLPQATPVYPVWVAVGSFVAGVPGALQAGVIGSVLGLIALTLLGGRYFGRVGLAAGPLLGACLAQAWFARYSAAEIPAQFFLLAGLLALSHYRSRREPFFALLAGTCLGLVPLAKAEMTMLVGVLAIVLLLDVATGRWRSRDLLLWGTLGLLSVQTLVHAVGWVWPYYFHILRQFELTPPVFFGAVAATLGLFSLALLAAARLSPGSRRSLSGFLGLETLPGATLHYTAALAVPTLVGVGYWLMPRTGWGGWNALNAAELGLVVSPWFVGLGALGAAAVLARRSRCSDTTVLLILMVLAASVLIERNIIPSLMWAYRRYVVALLPATFLFSVGGAAVAGRWVRSRGGHSLAAAAVAVLLLVPGAWQTVAVASDYRGYVHLPGVASVLEEFDTILPPDALVLVEPRSNRGLLRFEAALGMSRQRRVLRLPHLAQDDEFLRDVLWAQARRGGATYLLTTGYLNGWLWPAATPIHTLQWHTTQLEARSNILPVRVVPPRLPRDLQELKFEARLYRLDINEPLAPLPTRVVAGELRGELDVGLWDDLYLIGELLHQVETDEEHSFRWTSSRAAFLLPGMPEDAESVVLRVKSSGLMGQQTAEAWLDGWPLGERPVPARLGDLRFPVPPAWKPASNGVARLEIRVPAVVPREVDPDSNDHRELGIRVERVFWARAERGGGR